MYNSVTEYQKQKEFLICVDSDGCAMDTMDCKHIHCFGPCMVDEWELGEWKDAILKRWNDINLYTITRGINRFKGLAMALVEINEQYTKIEGIEDLVEWAENSPELQRPWLPYCRWLCQRSDLASGLPSLCVATTLHQKNMA